LPSEAAIKSGDSAPQGLKRAQHQVGLVFARHRAICLRTLPAAGGWAAGGLGLLGVCQSPNAPAPGRRLPGRYSPHHHHHHAAWAVMQAGGSQQVFALMPDGFGVAVFRACRRGGWGRGFHQRPCHQVAGILVANGSEVSIWARRRSNCSPGRPAGAGSRTAGPAAAAGLQPGPARQS
jgi:hypothetical protein